MQKEIINTVAAPQAIGAYQQAIKVNGFIYTSGQIGLKADGTFAGECVTEQTTQAMYNLKAILEAAGSSLDKLVKVTIFIKDMTEFHIVDEIYKSFLNETFPARSCVEVSKLPKNARVELEAVAIA